jgi:RND family efflux transporter MFP subunit
MEKSDRDQKLEQRNSQAAVEKAEEEKRILVEANRVQLDQAQAEVDFKKAELERLTTEYERKKKQAEERLIPAAEVEVAEIAMKSAAFAADKAEKDLSLQVEKAKSDLQQKETDLENALFTVQTAGQRLSDSKRAAERRMENIKRRLDEAKQRLSWCIVRAPTSGLVVLAKEWRRGDGRRVARPGDELRPGSELVSIPDLSAMAVDCKVAERDIGRVKRGQTVIVRLDERPKEPHYGRVTRISSVAEAVSPWDDSGFDAGTRVFTVTVELRGRAGTRLLPGMSASLEIVTQRIPNAVFVPKSTVFSRGADHVVYVRQSGSYHPVAITLGQENATHVCIQSGLHGGEWVATTDPTLGKSQDA